MTVTFIYDVVGTEEIDVEVDDYEWDEADEEEKAQLLMELECEANKEAEENCGHTCLLAETNFKTR